MASKKKRMTIHTWERTSVLDLGEMDIWDGADLALLRETMSNLVEKKSCKYLGVNLKHVKYIPSGFFGMLYDWHEKGVAVNLYFPQPNVANMLWFRQFFEEDTEGCHSLTQHSKNRISLETINWNGESPWKKKINGHSEITHATQ